MKNLKYFIPAAVVLGGLLLAGSAFAATYFSQPIASTALATSTLVYMTPGTATSTPVYDAFGVNSTNQNNTQSNTYAADETALEVQFTGSSTASVLNIAFEYSNDKIDWYQDSPTNVSGFSTTTLPLSLNQLPVYAWSFASSTIGGVALGVGSTTATRMIKFHPTTRYTRAVISCAIGGLNCAIYATFIPRKTQ